MFKLPNHVKEEALTPSGGGARKVIVATNVAETSLTIPGVVYVSDTGVAKVAGSNPRLKMHTLETKPISKASAAKCMAAMVLESWTRHLTQLQQDISALDQLCWYM